MVLLRIDVKEWKKVKIDSDIDKSDTGMIYQK